MSTTETTTCSQCAEDLIFPRRSDAYCENCGWPDECREPDEALIEKSEGKIIFIHDPECPGFCDYACNPKGQLQAELLQKRRTLQPNPTPMPLLEWDEEWGGMKYPEKRGYMRGDRSTTMWLITREVHDISCTLSGVFRADADEQNGILFDEAGAKDTAERLTRQWLEKHSHLGLVRATTTTGTELVRIERLRQILEEGHNNEHDATYTHNQLPAAALTYLQASALIRETYKPENHERYIQEQMSDSWPWDEAAFKPTTTVRDLTKAAALIIAEIDRLTAPHSHAPAPEHSPRNS